MKKYFHSYTTKTEIHENKLSFEMTLDMALSKGISPEDAKDLEYLILSEIDGVLIYIINKQIYLERNKLESTFIKDEKVGVMLKAVNLFNRVFYRKHPELMTKEECHEVDETIKFCIENEKSFSLRQLDDSLGKQKHKFEAHNLD